MIKMLTAFTDELDDIEIAKQDILSSLEGQLLTNTVGLFACEKEFLYNGTAQAICEALPFDVMGVNTSSSVVPEGMDQFAFSLAVLTSNDATFAMGLSDPIENQAEGGAVIADLYNRLAANLGETPKLLVTFGTQMPYFDGDRIVEAVDHASGGIPNIGTLGMDLSINASYAAMGGTYAADRIALLLLSGNIRPRFILSAISQEQVFDSNAIITKSEYNIVQEINNLNALEYMRSLGLLQNLQTDTTLSIPFVVEDFETVQPILRDLSYVTPEGHMVFFGRLREGSKLSLGDVDKQEVLKTARLALQQALAMDDVNGLLLFSCAGRHLALEMDPTLEMELVQGALANKIPYLFLYSGGEICPVGTHAGSSANRFHNETLVICVL